MNPLDRLREWKREYEQTGNRGDAKHLDWALTDEPEAEIEVINSNVRTYSVIGVLAGFIGVYLFATGAIGLPKLALSGVFQPVAYWEYIKAERWREELEWVREHKHQCPDCGREHVPNRNEGDSQ
jgi:hypothetical protein